MCIIFTIVLYRIFLNDYVGEYSSPLVEEYQAMHGFAELILSQKLQDLSTISILFAEKLIT